MASNAAMLMYEYLDEMELLTDEEFGRLCRFLIRYSSTGEISELTGNERFYAQRVMNTEDRFKEKYEQMRECRKNAGRLGGLAKAGKAKQNVAMLSNAKQTCHPVPVPVPDPVPEPIPVPVPVPINSNTHPSVSDVKAYCLSKNYGDTVNAEKFVSYYAIRKWKTNNGIPVEDWKAAVDYWYSKDKKPEKDYSVPYGESL